MSVLDDKSKTPDESVLAEVLGRTMGHWGKILVDVVGHFGIVIQPRPQEPAKEKLKNVRREEDRNSFPSHLLVEGWHVGIPE
ncbi:MAG: hypothetical protein A2Y76_07835 [Planctomycetes bacterium RBG_13_60_9]|nr:MAG: hypothetical protein A2Y76_07835 [Planctomycetes bacterium RBG_13_60_9]